MQVFWGSAEGDLGRVQGLWDAARGAVWSDAGEGRCGLPAAAGDGGDDDPEEDYVDDAYVDVDDDDAVVQDWSTPNEALPHLLSKKKTKFPIKSILKEEPFTACLYFYIDTHNNYTTINLRYHGFESWGFILTNAEVDLLCKQHTVYVELSVGCCGHAGVS